MTEEYGKVQRLRKQLYAQERVVWDAYTRLINSPPISQDVGLTYRKILSEIAERLEAGPEGEVFTPLKAYSVGILQMVHNVLDDLVVSPDERRKIIIGWPKVLYKVLTGEEIGPSADELIKYCGGKEAIVTKIRKYLGQFES